MPANQKLQEADAKQLLKSAARLIVAKGKAVSEFAGGTPGGDALKAMLGPTGNLRAPTVRVGKQLLVGFNEDAYKSVFG